MSNAYNPNDRVPHNIVVTAVLDRQTSHGAGRVAAIAVDPEDGRSFYISPEICQCFGITARDINRRRFAALVQPADPDHPKHGPLRGGVVRLIVKELEPLPHPKRKLPEDEFDLYLDEISDEIDAMRGYARTLHEALHEVLAPHLATTLARLCDRAEKTLSLLD